MRTIWLNVAIRLVSRRYKVIATLNAPAGVDTEGYNVYDFFTTAIASAVFHSREDAEQMAEVGYLGRDEFGVGCTWEVAEA